MVRPAVAAAGHNRGTPFIPEFIQPRHDPAAGHADLSGQRRKQLPCWLSSPERGANGFADGRRGGLAARRLTW